MPAGLTTEALAEAIRRMAAKIDTCAAELNQLDGTLGDGDLGVTLARGTQGLLEEIPALPDDVGAALLKCAQRLTKVSGSTFGTIMATGLISTAKATMGRPEVPWSELPTLLGAAIDDMARRGRSALGDKTVLDALDAIRTGIAEAPDAGSMLESADDALQKTLDRMRDMPAKQGRARILAAKSIGADDPGMVAIKRLIEGLRDGG